MAPPIPAVSAEEPPPPLTREALYELVWTTPLSALAARWGLSRNGLAKICDRLLVPYPGRGYWNTQRAERPSLPPAPPGVDTRLDLTARAGRPRRARTRLSPEARREQLMETAAGLIATTILSA